MSCNVSGPRPLMYLTASVTGIQMFCILYLVIVYQIHVVLLLVNLQTMLLLSDTQALYNVLRY